MGIYICYISPCLSVWVLCFCSLMGSLMGSLFFDGFFDIMVICLLVLSKAMPFYSALAIFWNLFYVDD